ncbi:MAG: T9SS type A sorting domain-containing protein [Bacteroidetes bacterium]|nr:T9SS type A sorting domain-containing protein [Bacteroidota bacterium]
MYHRFCATLITLLLSAFVAQAQPVFYVNIDATGSNTGDSWVNAFTDLQSALQMGMYGDEIWVAEGIYKPTVPVDPLDVTDPEKNIPFRILNGVRLFGGFIGTESTRDQRDWKAHPTILSGDLLGDDNDNIDRTEPTRSDNSWHVIFMGEVDLGPVDETTTVDGFTITGGNADPPLPNPDDSGGGLWVIGAHNEFSSPILRNLMVTANTAHFGGGMGCIFSDPTLNNVDFVNNSATSDGGGMHSLVCNALLRNVYFEDNHSREFGGGLMNNRGAANMIGVTFIDNTAEWGGGVYNLLDNTYVVNAFFANNTAIVSGGGMYNDESPASVMNAIFSGNRTLDPALRGGGGMGNFRETPFLTNNVFYGNTTARDGGAIFNINSDPRIVNSILWGNQAGGLEDEIFSGGFPAPSRRALVTASIVQGGVPQSSADGGGNFDEDPLFVDPDGADDVIGTADDNFHLTLASPAIDAGLNQALLFDVLDLDEDGDTNEGVPIDFEGKQRVFNGRRALFIVDLGVYEFGAPAIGVEIETDTAELPVIPVFVDAYPNPFRNQATLRYALPTDGRVILKVYDTLGREIATLVDQYLPAGTHEARFSSPDLASGLYLYHLDVGGRTATKKLMLIR